MPRSQQQRRSRREVDSILRRFRASGLSLRAFGHAHSISPNTLASWVRRERLEQQGTPVRALVPIDTPSWLPDEPFELEIEGFRIRVPRDVTVGQWRALREAWSA